MNPSDYIKLQSYFDGELSRSDLKRMEQWIESKPEAKRLLKELEATHALLAHGELDRTIEETRSYYWSEIHRHIEPTGRLGEPVGEPATIWQRWIGWLAPVSGLALLGFMLILAEKQQTVDSDPPTLSLEHEVIVPPGQMTAITFRSEKEGVTVVWMQSLDSE